MLKSFIDALSNVGGMSYSLADEPEVMRKIVESDYNINLMSKYADEVCVENVNNLKFLHVQWSRCSKEHYVKCEIDNPTALGNVAYLALHSPPPYSEKFHKLYDEMIEIV